MNRPILTRYYTDDVYSCVWETINDMVGNPWTKFWFERMQECIIVAEMDCSVRYMDFRKEYKTAGWCCSPPVIPRYETARNEVVNGLARVPP